MEQKTEASQAVDEPVLPHLPRAVGYLHTMDNTEGIKGNQPWRVFNFIKRNPFGQAGLDYSASYPVTNEALFTASQMKEYARAALKAQPAPTEARPTLLPIADPHTESKTNHIIERDGYRKVGYVLQNAAGDYCLSAQSAVRWLKQPHYWRLMHEQDGSLFAAQVPTEAAQGEDSARLDAYQLKSMSYLCGCKACNQIMTGRMMFICGKCGDKNCPGATNHLNKCIYRARASAETGGVKP